MPARNLLVRIAALATLTPLITLTGAAFADTTGHGSTAQGGPPASNLIVYASHTQTLSANRASSDSVACPAGGLPAGGGTTAQSPRIEQVTQAGFYVNPSGRIIGYRASVRIRGLRRGGRVRFAVQVACVPAPAFVIYGAHLRVLPANGASPERVACPVGALPVGGGAAVQNPRMEQVTQAGFYAGASGRIIGYRASVGVRGAGHGGEVRLAVQVACVPAPATVIYSIHHQTLSANGISRERIACPAGGQPVGGGTGTQDPRIEQVIQAGFYPGASGRMVGYQVGVRIRGLRRGDKVRFAVQVACAPAPVPLRRAATTVAKASRAS